MTRDARRGPTRAVVLVVLAAILIVAALATVLASTRPLPIFSPGYRSLPSASDPAYQVQVVEAAILSIACRDSHQGATAVELPCAPR